MSEYDKLRRDAQDLQDKAEQARQKAEQARLQELAELRQRADEAEATLGQAKQGFDLMVGAFDRDAGKHAPVNQPAPPHIRVDKPTADAYLRAGLTPEAFKMLVGVTPDEYQSRSDDSFHVTLAAMTANKVSDLDVRLQTAETQIQDLAGRRRFRLKKGANPTVPPVSTPLVDDAEHPIDNVGTDVPYPEAGTKKPSAALRVAKWVWDHRDGGPAHKK